MTTAQSSPPTVESYLDVHFIPAHLSAAAPATVARYRLFIRRAADFLQATEIGAGDDSGGQRELLITDLSDEFISNFSTWLTRRGMSELTAYRHRQCLRCLAADAQQKRYRTGRISEIDPLSKCGVRRGKRRNEFLRLGRGPKARTRRMVEKAASLFAAGHTLAEIAERFDQTPHAVQNWRTRYRAFWDAAYESAATRVVEHTRREAGRRADEIRSAAHVQRANGAERYLRAQGETLVQDSSAGEGKRVLEMLSDMASERAWGAKTLQHYRAVVVAVEKWSGRVLYACDFATGWLNKYLEEIESSHLASATVRGRRTHLLALWKAAHESGLCSLPPQRVRRVKLIHKAPEAWNLDEVNRLLSRATKLTGCYGRGHDRVPCGTFWRLLIRMLWDTGLRPGDVARLRPTDIATDGILQIVQGKVGRWHVCRLHASTLALVRELRRPATAALIPWGSSGEFLRREWRKRILPEAQLAGPLVKLRKSSASDVELHYPGMGAVHLGHHLSRSIAHNHYLDPRIVAKNRPMPTELVGDVA